MKTLLVATDFSVNAKHAAEYGYYLASQMKANLTLCNSFIIPAEIPEAGFVTWPMYEYEELLKDSADGLKQLKRHLEEKSDTNAARPVISCVNETGMISDVINEMADKNDTQLIIIGTHGANGLSQFIFGDHSHKLINEGTRPLLLVPASAPMAPIKKIAFATDFKEQEKDLQAIYELIELIRPLNAELLIAHITDEKFPSSVFKKELESFLIEISNKANYPNIYYRIVKSATPEKGLEWLYEHGQVDVLAMVHRHHSFFESILKGSHAQKMAEHIKIPLLVIPSPKNKVTITANYSNKQSHPLKKRELL